MNINWKVRIRNKLFWLALLPALLIIVETVMNLFALQTDTTPIRDRLLDLVNSVFAFLAILGVAVDRTTEGVRDSERAMTYETCYSDADVEQEIQSLRTLRKSPGRLDACIFSLR